MRFLVDTASAMVIGFLIVFAFPSPAAGAQAAPPPAAPAAVTAQQAGHIDSVD